MLNACDSGIQPEVWHYRCGSGAVARVSYENDKAVLQYQGDTHVLEQVISASGARYRNQSLEWWSKGSEATLFTDDHGNAGDALDQCHTAP
ncbi:MliC family protein [Methylobacillus arboreus]|uniref:MliC family protein n=1 Tax=Methylobacillus arboreus TaxID=755170 RepID=UPI002286F9E5|nr:MliC family protein [Methylobacillus arboreus]MCB5190203.1 MliC family protein [Methylobacillus arboreus]